MARIPSLLERPDGSIAAVNLKRLNEIPYHLLTNVPDNNIAIPADSSSPPTIMSISGEGPAQIHSFAANRDAECLVLIQIQDGQNVRALMNRAIHVDTIFGNFNNNSRAYPLPEALYIDETRGIIITATDISHADNHFRPDFLTDRFLTRMADPNLEKIRARMDQRQYLSMPSFYALDNGSSSLLAGGTNQETITIGQDSHFELFQITAKSDGVFDLNITNIDTGENLIDGPLGASFPISSNLLTGNAAFPFRFHEPRFFNLRSKLLVTLTDRSGAPNKVWLTLSGRNLADRMWS